MINNKMAFKKSDKRMTCASRCLIIVLCSLSVFSFTACGRRGDPVPIVPPEENIVKEDADAAKERELPSEKEEGTEQQSGKLRPDPPAGLMVLYTQKAVVLTWDEVEGQDVRVYKVYRSTGDGYVLIGDTAVPAFTDHDVKPDTKYYYKVTAVGALESGQSKEIVIATEVH